MLARSPKARLGRPHGPIAQNVHPLVKAVLLRAQDLGIPYCEIEARAGIYEHSLSHWARGDTPASNLAIVEAAGNVLGLELCWREAAGVKESPD